MSKVTQRVSKGKDENVSILPSEMYLAIHNRTSKNHFPLSLAPSRDIIENVYWYISESEGTNIISVLIKSTASCSQNATYYENKLLVRPERNQGGPHED